MEPQARTINLSRVFGMFGTEVRQDRPASNGNGYPRDGDAGSLENQLRYLNRRLLELNDAITHLEGQRDSVQLKLKHTARELHRQRAAQVKEKLANGQRVV